MAINLNSRLTRYLSDYSQQPTPQVLSLFEKSLTRPGAEMLSGPWQGAFLQLLIMSAGVTRILEIGTFTGVSALMMAEALPENGQIITVEKSLECYEQTKKDLAQSSVSTKIICVNANASDYLSECDSQFDLIFIDADKLPMKTYYELAMTHLNKGGLIVVDNVLWSERILEPEDNKSQSIHDFNAHVLADSRTHNVILPVRDGINLIYKLVD